MYVLSETFWSDSIKNLPQQEGGHGSTVGRVGCQLAYRPLGWDWSGPLGGTKAKRPNKATLSLTVDVFASEGFWAENWQKHRTVKPSSTFTPSSQPIDLPLAVCESTCLLISLSLYLPIFPFIRCLPSMYASTHLPSYLPAAPDFWSMIYLSSIYLSIQYQCLNITT